VEGWEGERETRERDGKGIAGKGTRKKLVKRGRVEEWGNRGRGGRRRKVMREGRKEKKWEGGCGGVGASERG